MDAKEIRLDEKVKQAISRSPYVGSQQLLCDTQDGTVRLQGRVRTYFQKQMAQEAIKTVEGVEEILNELIVNDE